MATMVTPRSTVTESAGMQLAPQTRGFRYDVYYQDGVLLTAVLVSLLYLIVALSLDAAGYVPSMALLIPVTLGAIAVSLLMAYSRFDSFFAFSHGMFTGLAWILFQMARQVTEQESRTFLDFGFPELQAKVYFVLFRLLKWVESATQSRATADNYMFIFEISFLLWWLTYLGIWSIFRYGYTWRAVVPAGMVLLVNTIYSPQPILGFLAVFGFLAVLLLVRTNLAEQQRRWRIQQTYFSQDISLDFLRTGFFYSLFVLVLAGFAPDLGRSGVVRDFMRPLNQIYEQTTLRVNELYPSLVKQLRPTGASFGSSLTLGGERNVDKTRKIFSVETVNGRYWRAVAFDTFDGRQWRNTSEQRQQFEEDTPLPVMDWQDRELITHTITLMAPTGDVVFSTPDIYRSSLPLDAIVQPMLPTTNAPATDGAPPLASMNDLKLVYSRRTLDKGVTYSIVSWQTKASIRTMASAGEDYPAFIREQYLQLPENFSKRVADQAIQVTQGLTTPYDKIKALETYLRTFKYNDKISAPPNDVDPVEYFLFDLKEGYCDYYATAMVLMLRSLGIPSRAVSGYAEGEYVPFEEFGEMEGIGGGAYVISEEDAHTWVEVFFPTLGWVEFEPTAGEDELLRPSGEEFGNLNGNNSGLNPGEIPASRPEDIPFDDPLLREQEGLAAGGASDQTGIANFNQWPWWVWAALAPLLLVAGFWGLRYTTVLGPTAFTPDLPTILFDRMHRWAERIGLNIRDSATPYEQGRQWGQVLPESRAYVQKIVQSYVTYRFGRPSAQSAAFVPNATSPAKDELIGAWRSLENILWKAWLRKLYQVWVRRRRSPFTLVNER